MLIVGVAADLNPATREASDRDLIGNTGQWGPIARGKKVPEGVNEGQC